MPHADLIRITMLLPAPRTSIQVQVVDTVITKLVDLCNGITTSVELPPAFFGKWLNAVDGQVVIDEILMLVADTPIPSTPASLLDELDQLKVECQEELGEDLIWITIQDIKRMTAGDPEY